MQGIIPDQVINRVKLWLLVFPLLFLTILQSSCPFASGQSFVGDLGIYDAAHEDDPYLFSTVWRVYSAVDYSRWRQADHWQVSTHAAVSVDYGRTFFDLGVINQSVDAAIPNLTLVHEVPTLLYDLADPNPAARWKIVWDQHLLNSNFPGINLDFSSGGLMLKRSPHIYFAGYAASELLLAGTLHDAKTSGLPLFKLPSELDDCLALTEPAALAAADGFYLAFHCETALGPRIPLVKFRHTAFGKLTLEFIGTLLSLADASIVRHVYGGQFPELADISGFSAPDLVRHGGHVFLIITPKRESHYRGCLVLEVTNLERAKVARIAGIPLFQDYLQGQPNSFRGACTYSTKSSGSGIVMSQIDQSGGKPFKLVPTSVQLP